MQPCELVRQIHDSSARIVLAVTGGGSLAISELLTVPGASRSILEAVVPYANEALVEFLRATPEHFCSARTARAMAMAAFWRATRLSTSASDARAELIGAGCTASLASDRPKRGPHRFHLAVQQTSATTTMTLELEKGLRSRREEEELVGRAILNLLAHAAGLTDQLALPLSAGEKVDTTRTSAPAPWQRLMLGEQQLCAARTAPSPQADTAPAGGASSVRRIIFPGAFNPLHRGHQGMAEVAAKILGGHVEFEISIENVDKPPLDYTEIATRVAQFRDDQPVWLTRAATFRKKSELFPGATFVVGADTATRIADARYYAGDAELCRAAIEAIRNNGCRFLVFGRQTSGGFKTLDELALPDFFRSLCEPVAAEQFQLDISSTALRRASRADE